MNRRVELLAGIALVLGVGGYIFLTQAKDDQPQPGGPLVQVRVPELDAVAQSGEALFNENCASCHGRNAAGQDGVAPPLIHKIYEPSHHADGAFFLAAARGVRAHHWPFGNMPPVEGVNEQDVARIVAYVRTLQRANGIF